MIAQEKMATYLCQSYGSVYCDDCLAETLVLPLKEVRKEGIALVEKGWSMRLNQSCSRCELTKIVSKRCMSAFAS